jgi:aminotransferase
MIMRMQGVLGVSRFAANPLRLSELASNVAQSEIRAMTVECDRMGGVNLAQGVCDTELPSPVRDAAIAAIEDGHNIYTRMDGIALLRAAISRKLREHNGIEADPETQVLVTSGATGALYAACLALFNPSDEIILFEPFYGYHLNTLRSLRIRPVLQALAAGTWELDVESLRRAITPRTRAIIINTPSNPCGKVFTRAEIEAIGELALEHDLFLLSDEIYEYFLFDGARHVSPASLPGLAERTITISGFSKTFSITGWRIGYLAADAKWVPSICYLHDLIYVCSPSPAQYGAAAGLAQLARRQVLRSACSGLREEARLAVRCAQGSGNGSLSAGGCVLRPGRCHAGARAQGAGQSSRAPGANRGGLGVGVGFLRRGTGRSPAALLLWQEGSGNRGGVRSASLFPPIELAYLVPRNSRRGGGDRRPPDSHSDHAHRAPGFAFRKGRPPRRWESENLPKHVCKRTHLARPISHEFGQLREHRVQPASTLLAKRRAIRLGVMITIAPHLTTDSQLRQEIRERGTMNSLGANRIQDRASDSVGMPVDQRLVAAFDEKADFWFRS